MADTTDNAAETTRTQDELIIEAMVRALDESLESDALIREILAKTGFNDPEKTAVECVSDLTQAYLRLAVPS